MSVIELSLVSLWFVNMAEISSILKVKIPLLEFLQEEDDYFYFFARHQADRYWSLRKREWTPKITSYMETVFTEFGLPQNIDDFRVHYRVSRNLFEIILREIYGGLLKWIWAIQRHRTSTTTPCLSVVPVKYVVNERVSSYYQLVKINSSCSCMRVLDALQELKPRVSSSLKFKKYSCFISGVGSN